MPDSARADVATVSTMSTGQGGDGLRASRVQPAVTPSRAKDSSSSSSSMTHTFPIKAFTGAKRSFAFNEITRYRKLLSVVADRYPLYLELGKLYCGVRRWSDGMHYLKKAGKTVDGLKRLLEIRKPEEVKEEEEKLRRMNQKNREIYIQNRNRMLEQAAIEVGIAQEKRVIEALFLLFHLYLLYKKPVLADSHMRLWLGKAKDEEEREQWVTFLHRLLTQFLALEDKDRLEYQVLLDRSLGPLGNLHLELLEELLRKYPEDPEYLQCLGRLYTRRRNYEKARVAFDRLLRNNGAELAVREHLTTHRSPGFWLAKYVDLKFPRIDMKLTSEWYNEERLEDERMRKDCVKGMLGPHHASNTVIYGRPPTGFYHNDEKHFKDIMDATTRTAHYMSKEKAVIREYAVHKADVVAIGLIPEPPD